MRKELEVYELIKQIEYFHNIALNINLNISNLGDKEGAIAHPSAEKRFNTFKEQVDQHIADIIDELQHAKNGAFL